MSRIFFFSNKWEKWADEQQITAGEIRIAYGFTALGLDLIDILGPIAIIILLIR